VVVRLGRGNLLQPVCLELLAALLLEKVGVVGALAPFLPTPNGLLVARLRLLDGLLVLLFSTEGRG
jgi:hypothetical protein